MGISATPNFDPEGLRYELRLALSTIEAAKKPEQATAASSVTLT
jgi:hypothetical protein